MSQLSDVNAFITGLKRARSAHDMRGLLGPITREMGFHSFALVQHVKHFSRRNEKFLALSNFGRNWIDYFLDNELHLHEPLYAASRRTVVGFTYSDLPSLIRLNPRQDEVRDAGRKEGITEVFCVPAHIPGEANGSCTFAVTNGRPLPITHLPMAQLVGCFAYQAARQLVRCGTRFVDYRPDSQHTVDRSALRREPPRLTNRQLDCVVLVARGKTDWEIAKILGIHEQTVTQHLNEARRRFDVSRRSQLVIHALYHGHLTFPDVLN